MELSVTSLDKRVVQLSPVVPLLPAPPI